MSFLGAVKCLGYSAYCVITHTFKLQNVRKILTQRQESASLIFFCRYTWLKDERPLEPKSNVIFTVDGIIITQLSRLDEGKYQCRADNQYGTSLSNTAVLRAAYVGTYISTTPNDYYLNEGQPFILKNVPLKSFPVATYSWHIGESVSDTSPRGVLPSKRLQIDEEGKATIGVIYAVEKIVREFS